MSIAEKLTTVAENQQKVYDAGYRVAIDRYCPVFADSGAVVECNPVENYPLNVVSDIEPIQSGSGEPSPTNVRPITGHTAVKVTITNGTETAEHNADLGQDVYAGNFDWSTGLLTLTHKMLTFTGEGDDSQTNWSKVGDYGVINYYFCGDSVQGVTALYGWCSHAPCPNNHINWDWVCKGYAGGYIQFKITHNWGFPNNEVETWLDFLKAQNAAGTPVQVLYELQTPITVQLTAQEILALGGTNTIQSNTGNTTVTGKGYVSAEGQATAVDYQYALREMGVNV